MPFLLALTPNPLQLGNTVQIFMVLHYAFSPLCTYGTAHLNRTLK